MNLPPDQTLPRGDSDALAALLRAAGRRPEPPLEVRERIYGATRVAWRRTLAARRRRRLVWALAASLVIVASGLAVWRLQESPVVAPVATAAVARGDVQVLAPGSAGFAPLIAAASIQNGSRIRTGDGALLSLTLTGGASMRVASKTELVLDAAAGVRLSTGTVYADNRTHRAIAVETPLGTIVDVGTQFEVRFAAGVLRTRVRSGGVRLERPGEAPIYCKGGQEMSIEPGRAPRLELLRADDDTWAWMTPLLQPPTIEGMPLRGFLLWVADELGRSLRFASPDVEARARTVRLHGSIEGLTPQQALDGVLAGTSLAYELADDGAILVTSR